MQEHVPTTTPVSDDLASCAIKATQSIITSTDVSETTKARIINGVFSLGVAALAFVGNWWLNRNV